MIDKNGKVIPEAVGEGGDVFSQVYNPDVLLCLANLSNDEVFTPPEIANQMLDMLPQELFQSPDTKFLDPACKSGVFLREIAKRLIIGLEDKIPDLQERIDHICKEQLYGIAITELTSLLSRRSLYCSKYPNGPFSIAKFDNVEGNIRYKVCQHEWEGPVKWVYDDKNHKKREWRKCKWCGASEAQFAEELRIGMESHAYEMLHTNSPEEIFNMKFDVIISNPPYQMDDGGNGISASPIYQLFIQQAKRLNPRFLSMIIPSRWFTGGKGLDSFRAEMLNDPHITRIVDYINSKDCFPGMSVGGGVCYFLRERDRESECQFTSVNGPKTSTATRKLNEFDVFIRYNEGLSIVHKAMKDIPLSTIISTRNPFGIPSNGRGKKEQTSNSYTLYSRDDITYIEKKDLEKNVELANSYKVMISRFSAEHAGEPDKEGMVKVLSRTMLMKPGEICTDTYIVGGMFKTENEANNLITYLKTKFARFLLLQGIASISVTKEKFCFVPMQDFSKSWTDSELYAKYNLSEDEIAFIESLIRPMEDVGGEE